MHGTGCAWTMKKSNQSAELNMSKAQLFNGIGIRYIDIQGDPTSGSIIVFPIRHRGLKEITHCISIYNSQSNYFKKAHREFYDKIMHVFAKRIELEHSLKLIKEKKHERSNANG